MSIVLETLAAAVMATAAGGGGDLNTTFIGRWDGGDSYGDVWAEGDYAYLAHFGSAGVDIIDISEPANPTLAFAYELPPPNGGASAQDVKVHDGLLFIGLESDGNSAHIVDVRDPENPVGLVDVAIDGFERIHNLFYADGYLYLVGGGATSVVIVDLTTFDPDDPPDSAITEAKWILENVGKSNVHDITVVGDRLYACAWDSGIWLYDVSDIANQPPQFLGSAPGNNSHSAWPTDDGQYVIVGEERNNGGITVFRMIEVEGPAVILEMTDSIVLPNASAHNQAVIGNRVYNAWYDEGLRVYDVHPVTGLLTLAAVFDMNSAWGIYPFLGPDRVLLSDIGRGLFIVDVDAPLPCPADLDGTGAVDFGDILAILSAWGNKGGPEDLDGSGVVDFGDILIVLAAWGPCA